MSENQFGNVEPASPDGEIELVPVISTDDTGSEEGFQPVPVPVPSPVPKEDAFEAISLVDETDVDSDARMTAAGQANVSARKTDFKREMNITGNGATRCRVFNSRIAIAPLQSMENTINDWIDENGIEVKQISQTVATLEGKHAETNFFITVWY